MDTWVEEIEGWETRPVSDGYAGLRDLAGADFSGAVSADNAWLFMVSGRVVGVFEYRHTTTEDTVEPTDLQRFEDADGTAYEAPEPSLPLLVAMKAQGGESRGKYYTEDTPLAEVQDTLESGGFTGFLELSENVLSGDYYTVYQAGSAADFAFVGNARRRFCGEDAVERARNEVGIYEVVAVDLDVVEVPAPAEESDDDVTAAASAADGADVATAAGTTVAGTGDDASAEEPGDERDDDDGRVGAGPADVVTSDVDAAGDRSDIATTESPDAVTESGAATESGTNERVAENGRAASASADETAGSAGSDAPGDGTARRPADSQSTDTGRDDAASAATGAAVDRSDATATEMDDVAERTTDRELPTDRAGDRERTTGSTDDRAAGTERASAPGDDLGRGTGGGPTVSGRPVPSVDPGRSGTSGATADTEPESEPEPTQRQQAPESKERQHDPTDAASASTEELEALRSEMSEQERELAEAREALDSVTQERDDLAAEVERLRDEVNRLSAQLGEDPEGPSLSPVEAFEGTNLFVRYQSKGATTLSDLHEGAASLDEFRENLRIEHHTTFAAEGATIDGRPFGEWLSDTQAHRFVEWLVVELLPEIRDSGAVSGMRDLYDTLPEVDRIEFRGAIAIETEEGTREVDYDVVCRDRMGDPLVVVATDESREPVREGAMADLVTETSEVATVADTLAGAFYVSSSFFEADALETAREAVSGSLLSRDRRRSFVKLSRKSGFHLCLVEARDGSFYLSVPDL